METKIKMLIVDADRTITSEIDQRLAKLGFKDRCNASPDTSINKLAELLPEFAILGPTLDKASCLRCLQKLKIIDLNIPILVCCGDDCLPDGEDASPFVGVHCISADLKIEDVSKAIENALEQKAEIQLRPDFPIIIGQNSDILKIRKKTRMLSGKDITVLITGESGTGKELIARSIHYHSKRSMGPLVKINCGALPDELLESEVFGFQRGAFTGAHKNKPGRLEMANDGTLFIDEIGDLSLSLQVKFLQVLEDRAFSRLGGTQDKLVDTRVVAATHADLSRKVREGTFRKDLFYRLNVMHLVALPLRERKDDIPLLTHYFMNKYCHEFQKEPLDVPDKILGLLNSYQWPGNVRELENVIRRAIVVRDWDAIFKEMEIEEGSGEKKIVPFTRHKMPILIWGDDKVRKHFREKDFSLKRISKAYVSEVERSAIKAALKTTNWNRKKASEILKVSYKTLLNRLEEFKLQP